MKPINLLTILRVKHLLIIGKFLEDILVQDQYVGKSGIEKRKPILSLKLYIKYVRDLYFKMKDLKKAR